MTDGSTSDLRARLDNQKATEEALLKLLGRAETVEAALKVQQTLTGGPGNHSLSACRVRSSFLRRLRRFRW